MTESARVPLSEEDPTFPPLLSAHRTDLSADPAEVAITAARTNKAGAGDLFWSPREDHVQFALVLEPEVTRDRCYEMVYAAMVAFADAAGALMPPEVAVTYSWPSSLRLNDGEVGFVNLTLSPKESGTGIPDWLVLCMDIEMRPEKIDLDPGLTYHRTTFWDEGCGHISRTELLNSIARHFLTWLNNWEEDGFGPIHDLWMQRLAHKENVEISYEGQLLEGDFLGLDETGNALLRSESETIILKTEIALRDTRPLKAQLL